MAAETQATAVALVERISGSVLGALDVYARESGFGHIEVLAIDADLWRFYKLV